MIFVALRNAKSKKLVKSEIKAEKVRNFKENSLNITDFENIENIVSENYFIFRPFELFKRKMIKFYKRIMKRRL